MPRPEKVAVVNEIAEKMERTQSLYLTDFTGLDVEAITELRRLLRENDVEYRVVKNTLARLAADKVGRQDLIPYLVGPTAMAFGYQDPALPARLIGQFAQKTGKPGVKVIIFEGQILEKEALDRLKNLPSREQLLAQVLGGLNSPVTGLVMVLKALLRDLVGVVDAIVKSRGDQEGPPGETAESSQEGPAPAGKETAADDTEGATDDQEEAAGEASGETVGETAGNASGDGDAGQTARADTAKADADAKSLPEQENTSDQQEESDQEDK